MTKSTNISRQNKKKCIHKPLNFKKKFRIQFFLLKTMIQLPTVPLLGELELIIE